MKQTSYNPDRSSLFRNFRTKTLYYKNSFFPYCVTEWNKLAPEIKNSLSISHFKNNILAFIRPKMNPVYKVHDPIGIKMITRLRLRFSHLREHKFRHNFLDTINPLCSCGLDVETTNHYLLRCSFYSEIRKALLDNVTPIIGPIVDFTEDTIDVYQYNILEITDIRGKI